MEEEEATKKQQSTKHTEEVTKHTDITNHPEEVTIGKEEEEAEEIMAVRNAQPNLPLMPNEQVRVLSLLHDQPHHTTVAGTAIAPIAYQLFHLRLLCISYFIYAYCELVIEY